MPADLPVRNCVKGFLNRIKPLLDLLTTLKAKSSRKIMVAKISFDLICVQNIIEQLFFGNNPYPFTGRDYLTQSIILRRENVAAENYRK